MRMIVTAVRCLVAIVSGILVEFDVYKKCAEGLPAYG